jgi:hypothetical protein
MLTLQYKFLLKSLSKEPDFTLYFARKANDIRPIAGSVFSLLKKNPLWKAREYERVAACHGRRQPVFPSLHDLQDGLLQELCQKYSSAYIFKTEFIKVWNGETHAASFVADLLLHKGLTMTQFDGTSSWLVNLPMLQRK